MLYGDLEGKNKIYDLEGNFIPLKDECIFSTIEGFLEKVEKKLKTAWRILFFDGTGLFILSDRRLVFLREPIKYETSFNFSISRFATMSDWEYWTNRANKAIEAGAKEFVEVPYNEIDKVKIGKTFSRIFVKSDDHKYKVTVDAKIGEELSRINDEEDIQPLFCFEKIEDDNE